MTWQKETYIFELL